MTLAEAESLLEEWVTAPSLRRHCRCVASALRHEATRQGAENLQEWEIAGLLHDFDYESHPDQHPAPGLAHLAELGVSPFIRQAIAAHVSVEVARQGSALDRALFACDELCGFLTAVAAVRPSKSILEVEPASVMKKLKTPAFAAAVSREDVAAGAELMGRTLEQHVTLTLEALRADAVPLGLGPS